MSKVTSVALFSDVRIREDSHDFNRTAYEYNVSRWNQSDWTKKKWNVWLFFFLAMIFYFVILWILLIWNVICKWLLSLFSEEIKEEKLILCKGQWLE